MHGNDIIFTSLEVGGRGALGFRIIRNAKDCSHFHGFGSGREGGRLASSNQKCMGMFHFQGFGSAREWGCWRWNHEKCIGRSSFSWFWESAGGGRLASESQGMPGTIIIFMSLEGGSGAIGFRIIRNAWGSQHFHSFGSARDGGRLASES